MPFIVIVEPLYFGVLPATAVPILLFMIPSVALAGAAVPWIMSYLRRIAADAQRELYEARVARGKAE